MLAHRGEDTGQLGEAHGVRRALAALRRCVVAAAAVQSVRAALGDAAVVRARFRAAVPGVRLGRGTPAVLAGGGLAGGGVCAAVVLDVHADALVRHAGSKVDAFVLALLRDAAQTKPNAHEQPSTANNATPEYRSVNEGRAHLVQSTPTMLWLRRGSSLQSMASWMQGLSQKLGSENGGGSSQELAMTAMLQTPSPAVFDSSPASSH